MAGQVSINDQSFVVDSTLANGVAKYQAVVQTANAHEVTLATAANAAKFMGIAQEDVNAGEMVAVRVEGLSYAIAAGPINVGDSLILAASGGQVESVGSTSNPNIIGRAIEPATEAGDLFLMKITVL